MAEDYLDLRVRDLLELGASDAPAVGGGVAAAFVIALAASLVAKVARCSHDSWPDGAGVAAQALELQGRCPALARDDADAWEHARAVLGRGGEAIGGDAELAAALDHAADLPLAIAEVGADVARLASLAADRGDEDVRGEAVAAALLAQASVRAAANLVNVNLATRAGDERSERAGRAEREAATAASAALAVEA